ncbi:thioesterase II family protein [Streptomyces sp. NPDC020490]|uniref:thioesterase II family protein n=1 Tax=Streptomyces sp. NPDC020490 TaxID=3365078 RepID=UPI0037928136
MVDNPWDVTSPDAPVRLFCLPWAGGSAVAYQRTWPRALAPDVDVRAVELPGRGIASDVPPVRRLDELLDFLLPRIAPSIDRPYAVFGHSMGAVLGLEIVRRLTAAGLPEPVRVFVSGSAVPGRAPRAARPLHELPENEFRAWLRDTGGTPAEVFRNPELLDHLSPLLRADFELCHVYRPTPGAPLGCPLTAIGGDADPYVSVDALAGWAELTTGPFDRLVLGGGHFAFQDHLDRVHTYIATALRHTVRDLAR